MANDTNCVALLPSQHTEGNAKRAKTHDNCFHIKYSWFIAIQHSRSFYHPLSLFLPLLIILHITKKTTKYDLSIQFNLPENLDVRCLVSRFGSNWIRHQSSNRSTILIWWNVRGAKKIRIKNKQFGSKISEIRKRAKV